MPKYNHNRKTPINNDKKASNTIRVIVFWGLMILLIISLVSAFSSPASEGSEEKTLSEVLQLANEGKLEEISVNGDKLTVKPKEGTNLPTMKSRKDASGTLQEQGFADVIKKGKVNIKIEEPFDFWSTAGDLAIMILPTFAIIIFFMYMMKQAQNMNNQSRK